VRKALAKLTPLVDGIRQSYGKRTEMRMEMAAPLMEIAQFYRMFKQSEKGIEACNEVIDALGPLLKYTYIPDVYLRMAQVNQSPISRGINKIDINRPNYSGGMFYEYYITITLYNCYDNPLVTKNLICQLFCRFIRMGWIIIQWQRILL
jgi:hypothetical protein